METEPDLLRFYCSNPEQKPKPTFASLSSLLVDPARGYPDLHGNRAGPIEILLQEPGAIAKANVRFALFVISRPCS